MKTFFIKNAQNIFFGFLFLISLVVYELGLIDTNLFIGLLGSIATIYFGALKLKIANDLLFKDLFQSFNERYDRKMNDLCNDLKADEEKVLTTDERNLVIDYFNLCAEEFLWYKKNRIPNDVWSAWKSGIQENLKIKQILEVYQLETLTERGKESYYGLVKQLTK